MSILIPILCQAGAFFVGLAEVLLPSMGILTIVAVGLFGYSWYFILTALPAGTFLYFVLGDILLIPIFIKVSLSIIRNSPLSLKNQLKKGDGIHSNDPETNKLFNEYGIVETPLRPTGKALFGSRLIEVVSENEFIDKGKTVRVTNISGNKITVEEPKPSSEGDKHAS